MAGIRKTYKVETIEKLRSFLDNVPEKPKSEKELNASAALSSLKGQIRSLQAKGYSLEEIVVMLKDGGMDAGISALKNAIKKPRQKKPSMESKE
jgi:hypothetical protein